MLAGSDLPAWFELLLRVLGAVGGVAGAFAALFMTLMRRTFATKDEVQKSFRDHSRAHDALDRQLADGAKEFAAIKTDLAHLPNQEDIADVKDRIAAVEGSVQALSATIDGLRQVLERVERPLNLLVQHHLKGGGN
jgi:septal ring factor EnvC (AmiA/AmiB activator)